MLRDLDKTNKMPVWLCVLTGGHVWTYENGKRACTKCGVIG